MYENLKGKKLLVIGSEEPETNIINAAHELGIYVIACDGRKKSESTFAKNIADESWDVDYSKIETIVNLSRESEVAGVLAGYSDNRVVAAQKIAEGLGTPFYANNEQLELTRDKRRFKDECKKYGIRVPMDYCPSGDCLSGEIRPAHFPVIVKPADNGGRNGITICYEEEGLENAIKYALDCSKNKKIIIEDYIEGVEFVAIYTLSDGNVSLSCFNEKYLNIHNNIKSTLCDLAITSTRFLPRFEDTDLRIRDFLKGIGAKDGVACFQGIVNNDGFWIFELGYRLNGGNDYFFIEKERGLSYMKMLISYSLTGSMGDDIKKDDPRFSVFHANYLLYASQGTVGEIRYNGAPGKNGVDDVHIALSKGMEIGRRTNTGKKAFSFKLSSKSVSGIIDSIQYINKNAVLLDTNGKKMLLNQFDVSRLKDFYKGNNNE